MIKTPIIFQLFLCISDSEILYTEAFTAVCAKYGKSFTWDLKASLLGFQGHECAEKIINTLELPITKDDFMKESFEYYEVLFPKVQLMPGKIKFGYQNVIELHDKCVFYENLFVKCLFINYDIIIIIFIFALTPWISYENAKFLQSIVNSSCD